MPVNYVVIHRGKLVIERWAGVITHTEIISHEKRDLQDGARSWEVDSPQHGVNAIVFANPEVACIWLGIDRAEAQKPIDSIDFQRSVAEWRRSARGRGNFVDRLAYGSVKGRKRSGYRNCLICRKS